MLVFSLSYHYHMPVHRLHIQNSTVTEEEEYSLLVKGRAQFHHTSAQGDRITKLGRFINKNILQYLNERPSFWKLTPSTDVCEI